MKKKQNKNQIKWEHIFKAFRRIVMILLSIIILLEGLELIKTTIIHGINVDFIGHFFNKPFKSFFISYFMTEITMSGSPIAGAFISLGNTLTISQNNLASILMGTRSGINSFLLITGVLMLLKGKPLKKALGITVIQFLVTLSTTIIASFFMFNILKTNFISKLTIFLSKSIIINQSFNTFFHNISKSIFFTINKPTIAIILGLILLIIGLFLFDRSFSFLSHGKDKKIIHKIICPKTAFITGFLITSLTMSISISIAILLPLYIRNTINKKMVIAYILGANISTIFDTLFIGIISESILGLKIILSFLLSVIISVIILSLFFKPFQKTISNITNYILKNKYRFITFTIITLFIPIIILFLK